MVNSANDFVKEFLAGSSNFKDKLSPDDIYADYLEYCDDNVEEPVSMADLCDVVFKAGYSKFSSGRDIVHFNKILSYWV